MITVTVKNGPGGSNNWVGLVEASAPDTAHVAWNYLERWNDAAVCGPHNAGQVQRAALCQRVEQTRDQQSRVGTVADAAIPDGQQRERDGRQQRHDVGTFSVTLSPTSPKTVTVNYATANGTATAGSDYVAASGKLTFAPGAATQSVTVLVNGDATAEPNETFVVTLSRPTNAVIAGATGTGTIFNDDGTPTPTLTVPASVAPGGVITVAVANAPGNITDWVGLVDAVPRTAVTSRFSI